MEDVQVGARVVRGPHWAWGDQDGGEGTAGTIVQVGRTKYSPEGTVIVYWDNGVQTNYRVGYENAYDLRLYDNASLGVKHQLIICNDCRREGIVGMRFKCTNESCNDYDLCQNCYMADKHDISHAFKRFDRAESTGVLLTPRNGSVKKTVRGMFAGAKVKRGKDWEWEDQDGKNGGKTGWILEVLGWNNETWRSVVKVAWSSGQTNIYRLGLKGKVDLTCVEPASPGCYYPEHLPVLGRNDTDALPVLKFNFYERVKVAVDAETLKKMQKGHNGWNQLMTEIVGVTGRVHRVTEKGDIRVFYPSLQMKWTINPRALAKVSVELKDGDPVTVLKDKQVVIKLQKYGEHGGWVDLMDSILGKRGWVVHVYKDGDLRVKINDQPWTLNPLCVDPIMGNTLPREDSWVVVNSDDLATQMKSLDLSKTINKVIRHAGQGNLDEVEAFFKDNSDKVNCKSENKTCLMVASHQGHISIVKYLLDLEADISVKDEVGDTALHYAAFGNHSSIISLLLDAGADVNAVNSTNCTALHISVSKKFINCAKVLLKYKPNVNIQDRVGDTVLHDAIGLEVSEAIELLVSYPGIDLDTRNKAGFNPLHHAAIKGNSFAIECILNFARHLTNVPKNDGFTPLQLAALNGHKNVVDVLVMTGRAEIDLVNNKKQTALMLTVSQGHASTTELLVKYGASLTTVDEDKDTALHMVLIKSSYISNEAKKANGPKIDQVSSPEIYRIFTELQGEDKNSLIGLAIACYLVEEGSDLSVINGRGKTPLDLVSKPSDADILRSYVISDQEKSRRRCAKGLVECTVCSELSEANVLLEPCGHRVACEDCTSRMKKCLKCHVVIAKRTTHDGRVIDYKSRQPSAECLRYLETKIAEIEEVHCCTICMERRKNVVFLCGHSACDKCSSELNICHMCRKPIGKKINLY